MFTDIRIRRKRGMGVGGEGGVLRGEENSNMVVIKKRERGWSTRIIVVV